MIEAIYGELAKIIARELYDYAKKSGPEIYRTLNKNTKLAKSGTGLPQSVLNQFEKSFIASLSKFEFQEDGYGYWSNNGSTVKFIFLIPDKIVDAINESDWVKSAKLTDEGTRQVDAFGDEEIYQEAVDSAVPKLVQHALKAIVGNPISAHAARMMVISPIIKLGVAPEGTHDFEQIPLFFFSRGNCKDNLAQYKLAKKLIVGSWLRKGLPPIKGPYLTN